MALTASCACGIDLFSTAASDRSLELPPLRRIRFPRSGERFLAKSLVASPGPRIAIARTRHRERRLGCVAELSENGESPSTSDENSQTAQLDLHLPRRRLQAEFTCNACQTRTTRLINPHAYERGTVYVQCSGCEVYHQLVDNLGLVVEFRYTEEGIDP
ncbi:DNL-type zinc finger protein-like [Selaginella moellendorffii]|uniref:DNL-type zinc finger protein-like n=1 Tax=Selaginella moellendorffii TaxID=88036 RepID=UPI000D1C99FD|nr:DNL-type zinc finger protein-like [Selaginella moellendorffii]|eukprot:XP_024527926.1 DNL-type zinc finger protein-like [Selaginella moellendorffii]